MGEHTNIAWCDDTYNPWWGCTEVSPACDFCYARIWSKRTGGPDWGTGIPRRKASVAVFQAPFAWHRKAMKEGKPRKVFCSSMSDFLDNEVDPAWRIDAWRVIRETTWLRWQILSKRIGNAEKMLPDDWTPERYSHVGFMATIANQAEANRDIKKLLDLKFDHGARWIGLSVEPMLGPGGMDPTRLNFMDEDCEIEYNALTGESMVLNSRSMDAYSDEGPRLDWIIIGGESHKDRTKARQFHMAHALPLIEQCQAAGTPIFFKQLGSRPIGLTGEWYETKHWKGEDQAEWPPEFRVQQFPEALLQ